VSITSYFFKELDDLHSSKKEDCVSYLKLSCVLSVIYIWLVGDAGHALALHGLVQRHLDWRGPVWFFILKIKMKSHIYVSNVRKINPYFAFESV
jgi:hypothetical protein